jgi:subtilase family serine protease
MYDHDDYTNDEDMGRFFVLLDQEHGWGLGTVTTRSAHLYEGDSPGDYELTYEVRYAPLPDLVPTGVRVLDIPGGGKAACLGIENAGQQDAGPFAATLRLDEVDISGDALQAGGLGAGQYGELCVNAELPTGGVHQLAATVDEARAVIEAVEDNNAHTQLLATLRPGLAEGLPQLSLVGDAPPQPDLVVTAVRVAHLADGSGDCALGQGNVVLATVQNVGAAAGGPFAVRFAVRGEVKAELAAVQGLDPGATADVVIPTDDMNRSDQSVKAIADGNNEVAEFDEGNNTLAINVHCA